MFKRYKKQPDGTNYKIVNCKKYIDISDCPKDFFDCFGCEFQTLYMKFKSRHLSKEYIKENKSRLEKMRSK